MSYSEQLIETTPKISFQDEWLTTEEAAKYLKISKGSLLNMVSYKKVKRYKLGRRNRYLKSELFHLLVPETIKIARGLTNGL